MSDEADHEFFKLRKQAKTYISKVFTFDARNPEWVRNVRMIIDGSDSVHLGEIDGAMCLRLTGDKRRTQVSALISQDDKRVKRVTLQTFKTRSGDLIEPSRRRSSASALMSSIGCCRFSLRSSS